MSEEKNTNNNSTEAPKQTPVSSLGEFGLISHLTKNFKEHHAATIVGIGDDAAVINNKDKQTVVSTDLLIEGIHFDLMYTPLKHLGYKSVVVNLSDIYAMNAIPKQITVSIALSSRFTVEALDELYEGIRTACNFYEVDLVGGDTSSSNKGLFINVTAIGQADAEDIVLRSGAKEGDYICISGDLGGAYLGLQILEREKKLFLEHPDLQPVLGDHKYVVGRQLKPEARNDMIELFDKMRIKPTSMIDISDGLASELLHICQRSKVGCRIFEPNIPFNEEVFSLCKQFNLSPITVALSGGEDYELLFTISPDDINRLEDTHGIAIIGRITNASEGAKLFTKSGQSHEIIAQGWQHL